MKYIQLKDGSQMPRLGQGTWFLGDHASKRSSEIEALQTGISLGMDLIDTAEMYGGGRSEKLIGAAIQDTDREKLFLVSKVYPHNAGRKNIFKSCDASLERLGTDYLDLYLLHWRGGVPLAETVACMEELIQMGKIRRWGVSNFDTYDMKELLSVKGGEGCMVNQVLYHLGSRGVEYDLLPFLKDAGIPLMAYCPLAQAGTLRRGLLSDPGVLAVAKRHQATPEQILLAFVLHDENTIAIPRTGRAEHTRLNAAALDIQLSDADLAELSAHFPAPSHKVPLDIV